MSKASRTLKTLTRAHRMARDAGTIPLRLATGAKMVRALNTPVDKKSVIKKFDSNVNKRRKK